MMQLVKWIRCFFAREGSISSVFCLWDYMFSNLDENFKNLDYLCLSLIQFRRSEFFQCEEMHEGIETLQSIPSIEDPLMFIDVS